MAKKYYFIGIGGIGVSALARYYLSHGFEVSGSDLVRSEITEQLEKEGVKIEIGANDFSSGIPGIVIHSPAVKDDNPQLLEARRLGLAVASYPQALGELTRKYRTIAVAGAHGKSTTTAMIGLVLAAAGIDPTVIVGTKVKEFGDSNFRYGKSDYLVLEACEYDKSFLNYWPWLAVVTNIEMDHMECYRDEEELVGVFADFAGHLPPDGVLVVCDDDANVTNMVARLDRNNLKVKGYSLAQKEAEKMRQIMKIPGQHNLANALAALAVGCQLGIADEIIFNSLAGYEGSWRRFQREPARINGKDVILVSDYGHHPTQIKMTIQAARQNWPLKKIICVFQPHQAWRTYLLFDRFVEVLRNAPADELLICDIYQVAGRESSQISSRVDSKKLVAAVNRPNAKYIPQQDIKDYLGCRIQGGEVVLVMGAGNIYNLIKEIKKSELL